MKRQLATLIILAATIGASYSQPEVRRVFQMRDTIGLYEKLEISMNIEAAFENPFDPAQLDIMATFISPSGKTVRVPGFYSEVRWSSFSVRFSPDEPGTWSYSVSVRDRNGEAATDSRSFEAVPSAFHGPIRVAANRRYLEHADGTPWYGVGMWYNGQTETEVLDELEEKGVNYISRLIAPLETWASGMGRYDQSACRLIDELLEELEKRDMQLALNFWFHSFLSETVWGGGNIAWNRHPYQLVCEAKDFYSSTEAWTYQEKLYRYMIARWGYSRSLAIWFVVDEVNGTDGWAMGDSIGAANWARKVHDYFKANDPWQHLTTGTRSGGVDEWWDRGYEVLDMPGREIYEAQGFPINTTGRIDMDKIHPLTYSYRNYHGEVKKLWNGWEKPAIVPETGWDHTFYEMSMPGYQAQFHNTLWVCLSSGTAMSPFWWAYSSSLNDNVVTQQFQSLRSFTEEIPFSKLTGLKPVEAVNPGGDAFAISSDQLTFGWAVNAATDMSGKTITLNGLQDGEYRLRLYHTWRGEFLDEPREDRRGTGSGADSGAPEAAKGIAVTVRGGSLDISVPVLKIEDGHARYIGQDVAFILESAE
jgi:hypothetical protein